MNEEMHFSGPHVTAALICEKVLIEQGNVPSFVRVVDRFTLARFPAATPPNYQFLQQLVQFTLVVMLKAGDLGAGSYTLKVRLQKPDMSYVSDHTASMIFNGSDDNGAMIWLPIMLQAPDEGLHWFNVMFEGNQIARIPLRIYYQQAGFQATTAPAQPEQK